MIISIYSKSYLEFPKINSSVMKNQTQSNQKMDPEKAPAPVKKLIEAAKEDLMDRMCIDQYISDIPDGIVLGH
jgi:hypothetical protein